MAEVFTSYSVDNDRVFRNALSDALKMVGTLKIPFNLISKDFYKSEQSIFNLKGPGQYPDFKNGDKSKYKKIKIKKYGFAYPLLKANGALANSLLSSTAQGSILDIKDTYMVIGTNIDYGKYHQSDAPRKKIPLRKFLFIGPEASRFATNDQMGRLNRWVGYINEYVKAKLSNVGKTS